MHPVIPALLLLAASPQGEAPALVPLGSISLAAATARAAGLTKGGLTVPAPTSGVELYRVSYSSTGVDGQPRRLSGLLALPKGGVKKGVVLYSHGTVADRRVSPSRYAGKDTKAKGDEGKNAEAEAAAIAFAAGGYALAMPDYLGLGDDSGVHPYPLAEPNTRSGIDMLPAVAEAMGNVSDEARRLFVTGYSEGGAVAMWTVRRLEEAGRPVTRAAPMSGPYDLSGVTLRSLLRKRIGLEGLGTQLFLLGYTALSARANIPGVDLRDYFAPSFASYLPFVFRQTIIDGEKGRKLTIKAIQMGAYNSIDKVLTYRFKRVLNRADRSDPVIRELARNDTYDWSPRTPLLLPYLTRDTTVVPENTTKTIAAMRARGIGPDVVRGFPISERRYDHGSAAGPAIAAARAFFDGGFAALPVEPATERPMEKRG